MPRIRARAIVLKAAEQYRKQYCKRGKWETYEDWWAQPEMIYAIALELRSVRTLNAVMGNDSWSESARRTLARRPIGRMP